MGLFGKSFAEKVQDAVDKVNGMGLGVTGLAASVDGKVVTLRGEAPSRDVATKVMMTIDEIVRPKNIVNLIRVAKPVEEAAPAEAPAEEQPAERVYEVVAGDTLGAIAQRFYGKASLYMKIFEANRDILDNPDLIKVGQKLHIPE